MYEDDERIMTSDVGTYNESFDDDDDDVYASAIFAGEALANDEYFGDEEFDLDSYN